MHLVEFEHLSTAELGVLLSYLATQQQKVRAALDAKQTAAMSAQVTVAAEHVIPLSCEVSTAPQTGDAVDISVAAGALASQQQ